MQQYTVTGMSCAACQARVEKAVSKVPGVTSCTVSLLTNSMGVEGTAKTTDIVKAVVEAGYGAALRGDPGQAVGGSAAKSGAGGTASQQEMAEALKDTETPKLKKRLATSIVVLLVLMYFSMGHMMLGFPIPAFLENHVALALVEMFLALGIMVINGKFFTSGIRSLMHGAPNMDTLVALGSLASFGYSLVELFIMVDAMGKGDSGTVNKFAMDLYFESAAMIPTLITVGKLLEAMSKGRTTDALKGLLELAPRTAVVLRVAAEGEEPVETEIPADQVVTGDIFVVRPGDSIPVDGFVIEGSSAVNESALTGESIPVDKKEGDVVSAATINRSGYLKCRATRVGEDTTLSQIIRMVSDAAATKAPLARIADKVSAVFVPAVIGLAILTCAGWLLVGKEFGFAIARGISVLVISCPCALGLATPVAIMVGNGVGAKNGILYKTAQAQEETGRVRIVALDKTGTITKGEPQVTDVLTAEDVAEGELLRIAVGLEKKSEHPLAKAVVDYVEKEYDIEPAEVEDFRALPGNGIIGRLSAAALAEMGADPALPAIFGAAGLPAAGDLPTGETKSMLPRFATGMNIGYSSLTYTEGEDMESLKRALSPEVQAQVNAAQAASAPTSANAASANASYGNASAELVEELKALGMDVESSVTLVEGFEVVAGNQALFEEREIPIPESAGEQIRALTEEGKTPLLFAAAGRYLGAIFVADVIKEDSPEAIRKLRDLGLKVVMLTGDNERTAAAVGRKAGVDDVVAGVLPGDKERVIRELQEEGKVAMVGDGINDAPALTRADVGIAIGAGTDVAIDAADVVVVKSRLTDVADAIRLSRATIRNIHQNLFWAFFYNALCIPLAMGLYGIAMKPMYGAAAMACSSFFVCMNALRLNLFKMEGSAEVTDGTPDALPEDIEETEKYDKETEQTEAKEETTMKKTMNIEGMMCIHCQNRVKKALEALDGVAAADVSFEAGTAIVDMTDDVDDAVLTKAVEDEDYKVVSIA